MEFKLDKTDRLIVNAAAKDDSRPVLHTIHITKGKVEATNGFILAERKIDYDGDDVMLDIKDVARNTDSKSLGGVIYTEDGDNIKAIGQGITIISKVEGTFPNTKALYPAGEPVFKISLSRDQLLNILKCFDKNENQLKFYFYGAEKPVRVEVISGEAKALLMPMSYNWGNDDDSNEYNLTDPV